MFQTCVLQGCSVVGTIHKIKYSFTTEVGLPERPCEDCGRLFAQRNTFNS